MKQNICLLCTQSYEESSPVTALAEGERSGCTALFLKSAPPYARYYW